MLSIICPTLRTGGLDLLTDSLARQTNTDFELILADGIHKYRAPHITDRLAALPFPVQHLASGGIELSNYQRSLNDAVVAAHGDVVLFVPDFTWFAPDTVEVHARWHAEHAGERRCLLTGYRYLGCPPIHPDFPGYHPHKQHAQVQFAKEDPEALWEKYTTLEAERYECDLAEGKLDAVMWSLWANPLSDEEREALPLEHDHRVFDVEFSHRFCSLKGESHGIEALLECNGFDEDLDGSHLYQDVEFSERLHRLGWEFDRIRGGEITVINPRPLFACKRMLRPLRLNESMAELKRVTGAPVNPHRNLRAERQARRSGESLGHVHV